MTNPLTSWVSSSVGTACLSPSTTIEPVTQTALPGKPRSQAQGPRSLGRHDRPCPARCRQAGRPAISAGCDHIHRHEGAAGVRRILVVLSLARKHGPAIVEDGATAALGLGVPTYRFLKRYLDRHPVAPLSLRQVDPLIRELTVYRDLIDRRTGDPS